MTNARKRKSTATTCKDRTVKPNLISNLGDLMRTLFVHGAVCLLAIGLFAASNSARGRDFTVTVPSGHAHSVKGYASWDKACNGGPAQVEVTTQPSHGHVSLGEVVDTITSTLGASRCVGQKILMRTVNYTSSSGYHGADSFTVSVDLHQTVITDTFTINVK